MTDRTWRCAQHTVLSINAVNKETHTLTHMNIFTTHIQAYLTYCIYIEYMYTYTETMPPIIRHTHRKLCDITQTLISAETSKLDIPTCFNLRVFAVFVLSQW